MEGDIIQYTITAFEALNILVNSDDTFTMKSSRISRRIDDKKDDPHRPGTSCFRKGYHKYERDWKRQTRRSRRHERIDDSINIKDLKVWAEDQIFNDNNGFHQEAFYVKAEKNSAGIVLTAFYEGWNDEDEKFYYGGTKTFVLTYEEAAKLVG